MKKTILTVFVCLLVVFSLCACGKTETPPVDTPEHLTREMFAGTYWKAVSWESSDTEQGFHEMPWDAWSVDFILYEDGSSRFRSVEYDTYTDHTGIFADGSWYMDTDSGLLYINDVRGGVEQLFGKYTDGRFYMEFDGGKLCFEKGEMPVLGAQWCLADLEGAWLLESVEIEGWVCDAEEEGLSGSICFFRDDYGLTANYVHITETGYEESFSGALVQYNEGALYYGCPNEVWSAQLLAAVPDDEFISEYYISLTDRNTLVMMTYVYYSDDEYPIVSVKTYSYQGTGAVG